MSNATHYETELKFRVNSAYFAELLKQNLEKGQVVNTCEIRQGYVFMDHDTKAVCRIRQDGAQYVLCIKQPVGGMLSVVEVETFLTEGQFQALWPYAKNVVEKTRHEIKLGEQVWTFDVFGDKLKGLVLAEIELSATEPLTREAALEIVYSQDSDGFLSAPADKVQHEAGSEYANVNLGSLTPEAAAKLINK